MSISSTKCLNKFTINNMFVLSTEQCFIYINMLIHDSYIGIFLYKCVAVLSVDNCYIPSYILVNKYIYR